MRASKDGYANDATSWGPQVALGASQAVIECDRCSEPDGDVQHLFCVVSDEDVRHDDEMDDRYSRFGNSCIMSGLCESATQASGKTESVNYTLLDLMPDKQHKNEVSNIKKFMWLVSIKYGKIRSNCVEICAY
jgi:hypothetical protein